MKHIGDKIFEGIKNDMINSIFTKQGETYVYDAGTDNSTTIKHFNPSNMKGANDAKIVLINNQRKYTPDISQPSILVTQIENVSCEYLIACGNDQSDHCLGVPLETLDEESGLWSYSADDAVATIGKQKSFWGGVFVTNDELTISSLDEFFNNNDVEHLVVGYATGKRNPKYHLREIVKSGSGYKCKPFDPTNINPKLMEAFNSWIIDLK